MMLDYALLVCWSPSPELLPEAKMGHKSWAKSNYETYNAKYFGMSPQCFLWYLAHIFHGN